MKWYYEWKLKRVRAEIAALEEQTRVRLQEDYTGHSRLRVLYRLAATLQAQSAARPTRTEPMEAEKAH